MMRWSWVSVAPACFGFELRARAIPAILGGRGSRHFRRIVRHIAPDGARRRFALRRVRGRENRAHACRQSGAGCKQGAASARIGNIPDLQAQSSSS